jgi:hypothetical protein
MAEEWEPAYGFARDHDPRDLAQALEAVLRG